MSQGGQWVNLSRPHRYSARIRDNSFETILVMRVHFLPYVVINYLAGFLKIRWLSFLVGTTVSKDSETGNGRCIAWQSIFPGINKASG